MKMWRSFYMGFLQWLLSSWKTKVLFFSFFYCTAALPNLTWPCLIEQAGTECCYAKKNRVCPLQAASYWLLSYWDAWQVWRCNLEHSSMGLRDSHRSTVLCLLNTAPDWQWTLENYVLFNDAEKSKMIKSGYNETCSTRLPNLSFILCAMSKAFFKGPTLHFSTHSIFVLLFCTF